jgi:hypothetical protein
MNLLTNLAMLVKQLNGNHNTRNTTMVDLTAELSYIEHNKLNVNQHMTSLEEIRNLYSI